MATTLGTVSTAIAGFAVEDAEAKHSGGISQSTVELITLTLLPVSIAMIAYALFTFYWRSEFIRRKQVGFFDDKVRRQRVRAAAGVPNARDRTLPSSLLLQVGPITLAVVVMISLSLITLAAIRDLLLGHKAP